MNVMRLSTYAMVLLLSCCGAYAPAQAKDEPCMMVGWSISEAQFAQGDELHTYRFDLKGYRWKVGPFGYHAPGYITGRDDQGRLLTGMYHFLEDRRDALMPAPAISSVGRGGNPLSSSMMATANERVRNRGEAVGYPYMFYSGDALKHAWSIEEITSGSIRGYAVSWEVTIEGRNATSRWGASFRKPLHLLIVNARDGCLVLETMLVDRSGDIPAKAAAYSLANALQVSRSTTPLPDDLKRSVERRRERMKYDRPSQREAWGPRRVSPPVGRGGSGILDDIGGFSGKAD